MKKVNNIYKFDTSEASKLFFTADTHFGHANIMKYVAGRPGKDIDEMNAELVKRWNATVPEDGVVFHLGDVGFSNIQNIRNILDSLHGKIYLIQGNHDDDIVKKLAYRFEDITWEAVIKVGKQRIYLNHFPFLCFNGTYAGLHGAWQLFGHVHSSELNTTGLDIQRLVHLFPSQYDVGVDNNDYAPVSYDKVKETITDQIYSNNLIKNMHNNNK